MAGERVKQLKNFIPLGAPATRRPAEGNEPIMRVSLGFCPRWFAKRLPGLDLGERFHEDPIFRYHSLLRMKRAAHERFPSVPEFKPAQTSSGAETNCATISGIFGIKPVAMLYGQPVQFYPDDWPESRPGKKLNPADIADLPPIDLDSVPAVERIETQMDHLVSEFGVVEGYLNYQGILNTAFALCGESIFETMFDDPICAKSVFSHIADTMMRFAARIQARQRRNGTEVNMLTVSNCVINMISPEMYLRLLQPLDHWLSTNFDAFGVHTCNWDATLYLDAIHDIGSIGYIDMGLCSDLSKARMLFPDARRAVMYSPLWIEQKSKEEIANDLRKIHDRLSPCDVVLADVSEQTDDACVARFLYLVQTISEDMEVMRGDGDGKGHS